MVSIVFTTNSHASGGSVRAMSKQREKAPEAEDTFVFGVERGRRILQSLKSEPDHQDAQEACREARPGSTGGTMSLQLAVRRECVSLYDVSPRRSRSLAIKIRYQKSISILRRREQKQSGTKRGYYKQVYGDREKEQRQ